MPGNVKFGGLALQTGFLHIGKTDLIWKKSSHLKFGKIFAKKVLISKKRSSH